MSLSLYPCNIYSIKYGFFSTEIMAKDALLLMDHLGWEKAHIVGYSMGILRLCFINQYKLLFQHIFTFGTNSSLY